MSYFDATDLWMGDADKGNAKIRLDAANSTITIASGGNITNSGGDYDISDTGIELKGNRIGKGGSEAASSITWDFSTTGDRAGLITTFVEDSTPTLDETTLWLVGGYDASQDTGIGDILLEANNITLDTGDDITLDAAGDIFLDSNIRVSLRNDIPFQVATMTETARDNISAQQGDIIYNTTSGKFQGYNGTEWKDITQA